MSTGLKAFVRENLDLSRNGVARLFEGQSFTTAEWLKIRALASMLHRGHNIQVACTDKIFQSASSLADWVLIHDKLKGWPYRPRAFAEIQKYDLTTEENIKTLERSCSRRLQKIAREYRSDPHIPSTV